MSSKLPQRTDWALTFRFRPIALPDPNGPVDESASSDDSRDTDALGSEERADGAVDRYNRLIQRLGEQKSELRLVVQICGIHLLFSNQLLCLYCSLCD